MLSPKKVKWRKQQKGRMKGTANRGNHIALVILLSKPLNVAILQTDKLKQPGLQFQEKPKEVVTFGLKSFLISLLTKKAS